MLEINKIYNQDCLEGLKQIDSDLIDSIVTDPPYGLLFMSKDWDQAVPSIGIWKECLRVLKSGAFAFVMCIPRQDCLSRMIINLQDAGFDTGFTSMYHTFASGFPKSMNISKSIDRRFGVKREVIGKSQWAGRGSISSEGSNEGWKRPSHLEHVDRFDTVPTSTEAKSLDGSFAGFQPKPAIEIILVAMKPLSEKSYIEQSLKNGKGITWLDHCRIPVSENDRHEYGIDGDEGDPTVNCYGEHQRVMYEQNKQGRFPANLLAEDDILNDGKITTSSGGQSNNQFREIHNIYGDGVENKQKINPGLGDSGSFSRYFSLDAWFDKQIENLPSEVQKTFPFLICEKSDKTERNIGCEHSTEKDIGHNRFDTCEICGKYILQNPDRPSACKCEKPIRKHNVIKGNFHPTCKPIKLFMYLTVLASSKNDIVLDPFMGSGTTAIASKLLGRQFIGFEIEKEYFDIANERLKAIPEYHEHEKETIQKIETKKQTIDRWL